MEKIIIIQFIGVRTVFRILIQLYISIKTKVNQGKIKIETIIILFKQLNIKGRLRVLRLLNIN